MTGASGSMTSVQRPHPTPGQHRRGGPVTLRDVASEAGVHPSTASRALNPATSSSVSLVTAARVRDAAEALGYRPNSLARSLRTNRTHTVGMVVPDLTNPLFPPIARGIEDRLGKAGYTLILANTDHDDTKERAVVETLTSRRVDGLVLATARRDHPLLEELLAEHFPIVLVNRSSDQIRISSVTGDDHAGIGLAVRHLAALGHRRIAFVGGTREAPTGLVRYQSFISWMESEGLHFDPELVAFAESFREETGAAAFAELLDRGADFTGVVTGNDLIALGCYDVARERGLSVPGVFSVVGYNDIPFCENFHPPLTSIRIPHYEIGVKAAELLLAGIGDPTAVPVSMRLPSTLVVRESTAPPNREGAQPAA
jgi:LacI family transcriptional regulator